MESLEPCDLFIINSFPLKEYKHSTALQLPRRHAAPTAISCVGGDSEWEQTEVSARGILPRHGEVAAGGKMALVVMLGTHKVRMHRHCFGSLLVTSVLNGRTHCPLCAGSSSHRTPSTGLRLSQVGKVHNPRELGLHRFPLMPKPHDLLLLLTIPDRTHFLP